MLCIVFWFGLKVILSWFKLKFGIFLIWGGNFLKVLFFIIIFFKLERLKFRFGIISLRFYSFDLLIGRFSVIWIFFFFMFNLVSIDVLIFLFLVEIMVNNLSFVKGSFLIFKKLWFRFVDGVVMFLRVSWFKIFGLLVILVCREMEVKLRFLYNVLKIGFNFKRLLLFDRGMIVFFVLIVSIKFFLIYLVSVVVSLFWLK